MSTGSFATGVETASDVTSDTPGEVTRLESHVIEGEASLRGKTGWDKTLYVIVVRASVFGGMATHLFDFSLGCCIHVS